MGRLLSLLLFIGVFLFPSCERCIECSATRGSGDNQVMVIPPENYCGNKKQVDRDEKVFNETCALEQAANPGTECHCLARK